MRPTSDEALQESAGVRAGLVARIAAHAVRQPSALAVAGPDAALSYGQLWARALTLRDLLLGAGLRPGEAVALCLPRSADLVVGVVGIVAAGGYYVALDPAQPVERLRFSVADSGARLVVSHKDGYGLPPERRVNPLSARTAEPGVAVDGEPGPVVDADPDAPAYVIYTSGSTGEPKGVLVEHAGVANLVDWHQRAFGLTAGDRTTLLASPGFDASVWEIWPSLTAGASLHVPPEALKTDPVALRDWLLAEGITVSFLPTPLAEAVLALDWPGAAPLRFLLTGGDVLHHRPPPGLPFALVNNYGLSEASVVTTSGTVAPAAAAAADERPSMGAAIDGVDLDIVDEAGHPVADGAAGELVIGGVSVARGYVNRPELTRQKFRTSPSGARTYRSGDLVRRRADGALEYLGRVDEQVQLRGFRIELPEIDAVLARHPAVRAAAVVVGGSDDAQFLTGYVVAATDTAALDPEALRTHAATHLPEHMVPRDFVTLRALPTTVSGKVDRRALHAERPPAPEHGGGGAARTDTERAIAAVVAERLALPDVGVDDNFFLLGGHSMLGAQLIIRISEQFGVELSLRTLFEHPTVAEMAAEVERLVEEEVSAMTDEELLAAAAGLDEEGSN